MSTVFQTLDKVTTGYTVFEKDQVLTEQQLNGLVEYLDDAGRLTRVAMIGAGIGCGLRARLAADLVTLARGVGATTDGDLFLVPAEVTFDRFKVYGDAAPAYRPFGAAGQRIPAWELIEQGPADPGATSLGQFAATTQRQLADLVAVLLMESVAKDEDLCSGTDCDNRGKHVHHTRRLILIEPGSARRFLEDLETPRRAAAALRQVAADRVRLSPATDTPATFAGAYRTGCRAIQEKLLPQLGAMFRACGRLLDGRFSADPGPEWTARLTAIASGFANAAFGIQYYYDFLKDLAETWNDLCRLLQEDATVCAMPLDAFPKHLVLGRIVPGADPDELRTGWYPSPLVSATRATREHARFLASKLDVLIRTFRVPADPGAIRVTPSRFEDAALEERAIPWYFDPAGATQIHTAWSWDLSRRGMASRSYGYDADAWGGPQKPLEAQIGRYGFFRVEGHLGKTAAEAMAVLEREIRANNLPFTVRAILLDRDRRRIVVKPPRYTDLHRIHHLYRSVAVNHLNHLKAFTEAYGDQVTTAATANVLRTAPDVTARVQTLAARTKTLTTERVASAQQKLLANDPTWEIEAANAASATVEMRQELSGIAKTDFLTPMETLVANPNFPLVRWLGEIIQANDDAEDDRLMFEQFVAEYPGVEHFGGVVRGGTFVLVYAQDGRVVGDVMLPCCLPMARPVKLTEPELKPADVRPTWTFPHAFRFEPSVLKLIDDGIKIQVGDKLGLLATEVQRNTVLVDALQKFTTVPKPTIVTTQPALTDAYLGLRLQEMDAKAKSIDYLRAKTLEPDLDAGTRRVLEGQLRVAEAGLATAITETSRYVAESSRTDVAKDSDGFVAMTAASDTMTRLSDPAARTTVKEGLTSVTTVTADKPALTTMIKTMLRRPGF